MLLSSMVIFFVTQLLPGDVAQVMLGQFATKEAVENLREELGLNRPVIVQYLDWLTDFVTGDWGVSQANRLEVRPMVMGRLRNSAMLAGLSLIIYVPMGILLGVIAAMKQDKFLDQAFVEGRFRLRVIHGFGKGILRRSLHEMFTSHPHVEKFYPAPPHEGGAGATIVELKM